MPIFEYKCEKCGHTQEFLEKTSKGSEHLCPKCKTEKMKKQFSTFSCGGPATGGGDEGSCPTGTCPFA